MPVTHEPITVRPPAGHTLSVELLDQQTGATVTAYDSQTGDGVNEVCSWPKTVPSEAQLWVPTDGRKYNLSAKIGAVEIAGGNGKLAYGVRGGDTVAPVFDGDVLGAVIAASAGGSTPVSKVLVVRYGTATALAAGVRQYLDPTFFATLDAQEVVGTDLSIQGDGSIVTANGGQFLISLWCNFSTSGLAVNEEVNVRLSIPSSGTDSGADAFWNVNLPAGTAWATPPAQTQARCGPCTFPPGGSFYGWVTLGPLSQGSVTLEDVEFMVTRIG